MKIIISVIAIFSSLLLSCQAFAIDNGGQITIYAYGNGQYVSDKKKSKRIYTSVYPFNWLLYVVDQNSIISYNNITSSARAFACIYDSSGSVLAKMDSSCNDDYPRAEWKFESADFKGPILGQRRDVKIKSKRGTCLEVDPKRDRLKAVKCVDGDVNQRFSINR